MVKMSRIVLALSAVSLSAQQHHPKVAPSQSLNGSAAVIDGARNPELIPDSVAREMILKAWAEPLVQSAQQSARQRAKLAPLQLQPLEYAAVTRVVANFHEQITDLENRYRASLAQASGVAALNAEKEQIVSGAVAAIVLSLSSPAQDRFLAHVQHEKSRIKIIPFPNMPK